MNLKTLRKVVNKLYKFMDISLHVFTKGNRRGTWQTPVKKEYKLVSLLGSCGLERAALAQGLGKGSCFFGV